MLFNYLKILFRNLIKRKVYTFVNILGLAIGITSFILIMFYVSDELSYDKYHRDSDRIYRVCMIYDVSGVGENSASMPFPVAFGLKNDYPDMIKDVVRVFNFQSPQSFLESEGEKFSESRLFFADSTFFNIFDHEFISGDPATALDEPFSLVITQSMALKYFNGKDPMGQTIKFETRFPLKVTGVIRDVPSQSHFVFDFIASMGSVRQIFNGRLPGTWVWNPCWTYILLPKGVNGDQLEGVFPDFIKNHFDDAQKEGITMYLQQLKDIHLRSRLDYEIEPNSNYSYVVVLTIIAVFLLLIASINFMNLATATSFTRAREIGIRKVTGAWKLQLIMQFIGESLVMTLISLGAAMVLIELLLPAFNDFTGKSLAMVQLLQPVNLLYLAGLWLLLGIISGIYPAFYLSSFRPITILKGSTQAEGRSGAARKVLVVFQFVISISLIIGTIIIFQQVSYLRSADLGFDPDNVILLPVHRTKIASNYETFRERILQNPDILEVTAVDDIVGAAHNTHEFRFEGMTDTEWRFFPALVVQYNFLKTFRIELVAGRDYDKEIQSDPMKSILVNESLVRHMGWKSNEDALGRKFRSLNGDEKIIGVFKDFQATSLRELAGPFILNMKETENEILYFLRFVAVRTVPGKMKETIHFLEQEWGEFETDRPFDYNILNKELSRLYKDETKLGTIAFAFTVLILFVAALGLFGLASFMVEKRTKEIGIRKVMGASLFTILVLLMKEFARLVLIATVVAWPLAYLLIDELFLNQFAMRVKMDPWVFILSGLFAFVISMLIILYRAVAASMINPAETLKYE